jgi:hypothetical protein
LFIGIFICLVILVVLVGAACCLEDVRDGNFDFCLAWQSRVDLFISIRFQGDMGKVVNARSGMRECILVDAIDEYITLILGKDVVSDLYVFRWSVLTEFIYLFISA